MVRDNGNRKASYRDGSGFEQPFGRSHVALAGGGTSLRDSELIELLRRAMAGDDYPVSGGRQTAAVQDNQPPLTSRIREILQNDPTPAPSSVGQTLLPPVDNQQGFVEPEPDLLLEADLAPPVSSEMPVAAAGNDMPLSAVWLPSLRATGLMVLMTLVGGSIPALTASPPGYVAQASLRLVGDAVSVPGLLDATAARLSSSHILSQAVSRLKLEANPEFNGGGATAYGIAKDLFTDNGGASDNLSRAQAALRERLTVNGDPQAGIIRLSVRSEDASQSVRITNLLAQIAVSDAALSPVAGLPSSSPDTTRKAYDDAVAALDGFKAKVGEDKIEAALRLQRQSRYLDGEIARATQAAQSATVRLTAAKTVKLSDVLTGSISPDLGSPAALEDLRNRYASAKGTLAVLATQLGPRHPRLLAQQSTVDTLSNNIMGEIQKLVGENETAARQANEQLKQLKARAAGLDATVPGLDIVQLDRLQAEAETARAAYENELSAPVTSPPAAQAAPLALVAPATAMELPSNGSTIANEIQGAMIGFGIAFCVVAGRMFMRQFWRNAAELPAREIRRPPTPQAPLPKAVDAPTHVHEEPPRIPAPVERPVDRTVSEARQNVASLRARVESYAAQRPARR